MGTHIIQSDTMLPQAVFSLLVTLLVLDSCQPTNGSRCPDKWLDASFVQMGCLLFDSSKALDWDDANNFCQFDKNSSLVELKKVEQLQFVQMELKVIADHEGVEKTVIGSGPEVVVLWGTSCSTVCSSPCRGRTAWLSTTRSIMMVFTRLAKTTYIPFVN